MISLKKIWILITFAILNTIALAQPVVEDANWRTYRLDPYDITATFPKLPVVVNFSDGCLRQDRFSYKSYAGNVVYSVSVRSESTRDVPKHCDPAPPFNNAVLNDRVDELKGQYRFESIEETVANGERRIALTNDNTQILILADIKNKRFFEVSTFAPKGYKYDRRKFEDGFNSRRQVKAINVDAGASQTIGDKAPFEAKEKEWISAELMNQASQYRLISIPKAMYTDAARTESVEGTVRVKVTLLANGGVGAVTPVTNLPFGLTEQAISAARRMVFLPKRVNGENVSVIVTVDYSFSLY